MRSDETPPPPPPPGSTPSEDQEEDEIFNDDGLSHATDLASIQATVAGGQPFPRYDKMDASTARQAFEIDWSGLRPRTRANYGCKRQLWRNYSGGDGEDLPVTYANVLAFVKWAEQESTARIGRPMSMSSFGNLLSALWWHAADQYTAARAGLSPAPHGGPDDERARLLELCNTIRDPSALVRTLHTQKCREYNRWDLNVYLAHAKRNPSLRLTPAQARQIEFKLISKCNGTRCVRDCCAYIRAAFKYSLHLATMLRSDETEDAKWSQMGVRQEIDLGPLHVTRNVVAYGLFYNGSKSQAEGYDKYSFRIPHMDVPLCSIGLEALYLFLRYQASGIQCPDLLDPEWRLEEAFETTYAADYRLVAEARSAIGAYTQIRAVAPSLS